MKMSQKNHSLFFSVLMHLIVLAFLGMKLNVFRQEINLGEIQSPLSAYVYQDNFSNRLSSEKVLVVKPAAIMQLSKNGIVIAKSNQIKRSQQLEKSTKQQIHSQQNRIHVGNGKPIPELVALLHAAIEKQQQYPASALQMEREGNTTLMFVLFPNGEIKDLRIASSSGTAVLDEAAIAAVNHATPFEGVDKYLAKPEEYQVTVGFELT
ncbi:MAG: energy transducer TonB [Gammaproteobacteria bacterium]|nr:energy transducer TonB [Gammaproteobacteria bacterium]